MLKLFVLAGLAVVASAAGAEVRAGGVPYQSFQTTNGAGSCQAALPSYEVNLRKRPTAIANEGQTNAFVSCSIASDFGEVQSLHTYAVVLNNNTAGDVEMSCTLVSGIRMNGLFEPTYFPRTFVVPAGGHSEVSWRRSELEPTPTEASANWSCNLPPGTEVGATYAIVMVMPAG
ncbi:MAG TPA: hypothetical protein VLK29_00810 [Luteimonas sp.]|nr:hypothetical protein [Luteimonas sp.]